jgi:hypothetical protein
MDLKIHFLPSDNLKLQISRGRKNVNLRARLTRRYHILPLVKMKNELGAVDKTMFQGVRHLCKLIFRLYKKTKMRSVGDKECDV